MLVLPAIDIRGGRCVRLRQGDYGQETVFHEDPVIIAKRWVSQGADFLHLVDLDGAKAGRPVNTDVIVRITQTVGVPCQLGGGLRDESAIDNALSLGVTRVIVGTRAVRDPAWVETIARRWPQKVVLGLDAKNGLIATEGWLETTAVRVEDLLKQFAGLPLSAVVYTDIAKDGMMSGPNFDATEALARVSPIPVIASGGVTTIDDVLELARRRIPACILGRTLYEGAIQLPELFSRLREIDSGE